MRAQMLNSYIVIFSLCKGLEAYLFSHFLSKFQEFNIAGGKPNRLGDFKPGLQRDACAVLHKIYLDIHYSGLCLLRTRIRRQ